MPFETIGSGLKQLRESIALSGVTANLILNQTVNGNFQTDPVTGFSIPQISKGYEIQCQIHPKRDPRQDGQAGVNKSRQYFEGRIIESDIPIAQITFGPYPGRFRNGDRWSDVIFTFIQPQNGRSAVSAALETNSAIGANIAGTIEFREGK